MYENIFVHRAGLTNMPNMPSQGAPVMPKITFSYQY